jgi:signal transduction histidine kinase
MKAEKKIVLTYTGICLGIIIVAFLSFIGVVAYIVQSSEAENILPNILVHAGWIGLVILLISGVLAYIFSKRYVKQVSARVNQSYQSEKAFISNASHEMNNPLTAIQGECEISLMKERSVGEYQAALKRIASETKRMILLMKHLLFLSHGNTEMLNASKEPIPLANFLMDYAQGRVHFSMDNFALVVQANPQLLKMALDNIIGNACKYSGEKPVYLDLRDTVLKIIDQGIGIPKDDLQNIDQLFYRASNTREISGNGVGLNLAIQILNFYGAAITIESEEGIGTRVSIDFRNNK